MLNEMKSRLPISAAAYSGKKALSILSIVLSSFVLVHSQDRNYWVNAPPGTTKIFNILFTDDLNGKAISGEGDILFSGDGGKNWTTNSMQSASQIENVEEYFWKADIYCSVMQTTDSGISWFPYDKEKQEHFCGVYLKDENSGYNVASNFLNKVTAKIFFCYKNSELNLLIDNPQ